MGWPKHVPSRRGRSDVAFSCLVYVVGDFFSALLYIVQSVVDVTHTFCKTHLSNPPPPLSLSIYHYLSLSDAIILLSATVPIVRLLMLRLSPILMLSTDTRYCCFRYQRLCGLMERHNRRDDLLYAMLGACGLRERLTIVPPARATDVHLRAYHDRDYIEVEDYVPKHPLPHNKSS